MDFRTRLEKAIIAELRCPSCLKVMFPPIRQCKNGHSFCRFCFKTFQKCLLCKSPRSKCRPIDMENLYLLLDFPCRYASKGCPVVTKSDQIEAHQMWCNFSKIKCPLRFNDCPWNDKRAELLAHCKNRHATNIYTTDEQKMMISNFRTLRDRRYYVLFMVFNNLFRFTIELNENTGMLLFAVYNLEKETENEKDHMFQYELVITDASGRQVIQLKAPCFYMNDDSQMFLNEKYLSMHYNMAQTACDDDNNLNYIIKIVHVNY